MLDLNRCEIVESTMAKPGAAVVSLEEGSLLTAYLENGVEVVGNSGGAATDKFAGVVQNRHTIPSVIPFVEDLVVPASSAYTITLSQVQSGSELTVVVLDANGDPQITLAAAGAASATEYSKSGQVLTLHSSFASKVVRVFYKKALSVIEANMLYGNDAPVTDIQSANSIGRITAGLVFTTNYNAAVDWGSNPSITTGAGGIFTTGGNGAVLDAYVASVPTPGDPFLGIRIKP